MNADVVTLTVCRPCTAQCGRTRGYGEPNPGCDSPVMCGCLCRQSNAGRR